jgi:FKBP-type peptidyl-prolyl cis-trans isomerase
LPQSRKRKTRRGGPSSRATYSSKKNSNQTTKLVVYIIIAALASGALIYLLSVLRSSGSNHEPGTEVTTKSGLKYIDEVVGTGESPRRGRPVSVHYTGTLANGTKFDSSVDRGQPYEFPIGVGEVIEGWDEGIMTMKVGGKRKLIIPPDLGYGAAGKAPKIPPNSTLYFDVELMGVK